MTMLVSYFVYLYTGMFSFNNDKYNSQSLVNRFMDGQNNFNLYEFNFLPSIEIRLNKAKNSFRESHKTNQGIDLFSQADMDNDDWFETFDISNLDLVKLAQYIKIQLKVKFRNGKKSYYVKTTFRKCTDKDFLKNGILQDQIDAENFS